MAASGSEKEAGKSKKDENSEDGVSKKDFIGEKETEKERNVGEMEVQRNVDDFFEVIKEKDAAEKMRKCEENEKESVRHDVVESLNASDEAAKVKKVLNDVEKCCGEVEWQPGDIVWAHMNGYPWWPGLVENDPVLNVYTKVQNSRGKIRSYHVQFFGEAVLRGWVRSLMKFEGEAQYRDLIAEISASASSKSDLRAKLLWFDVKVSQRAEWKGAVDEAEVALPFNREERRIRFGVEYFMDPPEESKTHCSPAKRKVGKKKQSKKDEGIAKAETLVSVISPSQSSPGNLSNTSQAFQVSPGMATCSSKVNSPCKTQAVKKNDGSFLVYLQKHMDNVKEENPALDAAAVKSYLKSQWNQMSQQQKARYRSRFEDCQISEKSSKNGQLSSSPSSSSDDIPNQKRIHKPTKRFLEADMNNLYPSPRVSNKARKCAAATPSHVDHDSQPEGKEIQDKSGEAMKAEQINAISDNFITIIEKNKTDSSYVIEELDRTKSVVESEKNADDELSSADAEIIESCPSISSTESGRSNGENRSVKLCQVCHNTILSSNLSNPSVTCEGICSSSFHLSCIGLNVVPEEPFKCEECKTGIHTCFVCKQKSEDVQKCTITKCLRFYHDACVKKYPRTRIDANKRFVCPLHSCTSCIAENPWMQNATPRGRLVRCVRCPTAYHNTDSCLAAGSDILLAGFMLCPLHFNRRQGFKQINVNWCFICSSGGSLICCESCPAAFHSECLKIDPPEGNYYCRDCAIGRQPKFGDIVWVKLGCYRWWPAQIRQPKTVPDNIQAIKHQVGEFPVEFFGSHDYYWTNRSRVFLYQEGDKGNENASSRALAKVYEKALQEATEAFRQLQELKADREGRWRLNQKPPPYKHIKINKPIGKVQTYTADPLEITPCECDPKAEKPCGSDSDCLNRMVMIECNPAVCPAGDRCQNQRFQKREYVDVQIFKTQDKGWGLKTLVDIEKGQFVTEYVGELIDEEECRQRMKKMHEMNMLDYYFLTIDKDRIIDACPRGNLARFMNHSCQPNCETQKWTVNGDTRVGLFAICDISSDSELTFNYNLDCLGNEKRVCRCQMPMCSGYIGVRPKPIVTASSENRKPKDGKKKKRRKPHTNDRIENNRDKQDKNEHEDECFMCKEGGKLIMCDKPNCPKAYHLDCLHLDVVPSGNWECPWHRCDVCKESTVLFCAFCPNSFCSAHANSIKILPGGRTLCNNHDNTSKQSVEESADENIGSKCANETISPDKDPSNEEASVVKKSRGRSRVKNLSSETMVQISTEIPSTEAESELSVDPSPDASANEAFQELKEAVKSTDKEDDREMVTNSPPQNRLSTSRKSKKSLTSEAPLKKVKRKERPAVENTEYQTTGTEENDFSMQSKTVEGLRKNIFETFSISKMPFALSEKNDDDSKISDSINDVVSSETTEILQTDSIKSTTSKTTTIKEQSTTKKTRHKNGAEKDKTYVRTTTKRKSKDQKTRVKKRKKRKESNVINGISPPIEPENPNPSPITDTANADVVESLLDKNDVNSEETATAIITVETDKDDGLELKPIVQKYRLENGEFSLEEYTESPC